MKISEEAYSILFTFLLKKKGNACFAAPATADGNTNTRSQDILENLISTACYH